MIDIFGRMAERQGKVAHSTIRWVRVPLLLQTPEKRKRTDGSNYREVGGREVALVR